jgi:predicted RNA binding protein YcfA (HicA-like mRNA interferase family)
MTAAEQRESPDGFLRRTASSMTYRELIEKVAAKGWYFARSGKGGHMIYKNSSMPGSIVIAHGGKLNREVPIGTANAVLRQAGLK